MMKKFLLLVFLICLSWVFQNSFAQHLRIVDSLSKELQKPGVADSTRLKLLMNIASKYVADDMQKSIAYAQQAKELAQKLKKPNPEAYSDFLIGMGHQRLGNHPLAIQFMLQAKATFEANGNQKGVASCLREIGNTYGFEKNYKKALEYLKQNVQIQKQLNSVGELAVACNDLGGTYILADSLDQGMKYMLQTLELCKKINFKGLEASAYSEIGNVHAKKGNYAEAEKNYLMALEINQQEQSAYFLTSSVAKMGDVYTLQKKYEPALKYYRQAVDSARKYHYNSMLRDIYEGMAKLHAGMQDYRNAFEMQKLYIAYKDSIANEESTKKVASLQAAHEMERKQAEIDLLTKDGEITKLMRNALGGGLVLAFVIAFILFKNNRRKKHDNDLLLMQNEEINQQKEEIMTQAEHLREANEEILMQHNALEIQRNEIARKNHDIESSIRYARRIQNALLPYPGVISRELPEHFILYKPKDIVSGDFYWFNKVAATDGDKIVIAAVDCTGHGVPGAFMSMLGDSILTQIVIDRGITDPAEILAQMHRGVRRLLKQEAGNNRDGMDMAICVIDKAAKTLSFAGARNPLYLVRSPKGQPELTYIKGDRVSIGGQQAEAERSFTAHHFDISVPTAFYLCSDGYQDQFGGDKNQKFMSGKLRRLLTEISQQPMDNQKQVLEQTFEQWKQQRTQVDDVLVMGVRVEFQ